KGRTCSTESARLSGGWSRARPRMPWSPRTSRTAKSIARVRCARTRKSPDTRAPAASTRRPTSRAPPRQKNVERCAGGSGTLPSYGGRRHAFDDQPRGEGQLEHQHRKPDQPRDAAVEVGGAAEPSGALQQQERDEQRRRRDAEPRERDRDHPPAQKQPAENRAADSEEDRAAALGGGGFADAAGHREQTEDGDRPRPG